MKKLLLLGAGGSGKSTFFKQLRSIHGSGINVNERRTLYRPIVHSNIVASMKTLVSENRAMTQHDQEYESVVGDVKVFKIAGDVIAELAQYIDDISEEDAFLHDNVNRTVEAITGLWNNDAIQSTWAARSKFQIQDSAKYFFENMDRVSQTDYVPSQDDVLRARIRTTGIVEQEFQVKGNKFQVFDVGGQRNERKKWIHCFEHVTGVLFLAALSAYDQTLYEDDQTNRMREALDLFKQISNSRWFKDKAMILFLNKKDLFQEKIQKTPITVCFKNYTGPVQDEIEAREFIKDKFKELAPVQSRHESKKMFCHFTCAIDRNQVEQIFRDVQRIIIHQNLEVASLI